MTGQSSLKLAYKDSPSGTDDFIDFNSLTFSLDNPSKSVGYELVSGSFTNQDDPFIEPVTKRLAHRLTFLINIEGTSRDDVLSRLRDINRYIQTTNKYFGRVGSNFPVRKDGTWQSGQAAVLTTKAAGGTAIRCWNILPGPLVKEPTSFFDTSEFSLNSVVVTLVVEAFSRKPNQQVYLYNMVNCADCAPPFSPDSTNFPLFTAGWVFTGTWQISTAFNVFGNYSLTATGAGATATSNEAVDFVSGDVIVPGAWVKASVISGTTTVKFQVFNGTAWADQQTLASIAPANSTAVMTRYDGTAYTVPGGITKVRLLVTNAASGTVYATAFYMWKNPVGGVTPVEFFAAGRMVGIPYATVYNVQGDVPAGCRLRVGDNITLITAYRAFVAGAMTFNPAVDKPVFGLDFWTGSLSETANSAVLFGRIPATSSTASTASSYSLYSGNTRTLDFRPRKYRAYLYYAANDSALITSVQINIGSEYKTYTVSLPQTYTGTANAGVTDFRLYDLGDYLYGRPGNPWQDNTVAMTGGIYPTQIQLTHSNSANRRTAVGGLVMIPVDDDQAVTIDLPNSSTNSISFEVISDGSAPRINIPDSGTANYRELNSFVAAGTFSGGYFTLPPNQTDGGPPEAPVYSATRFEMLVFSGRNGSDARQLTLNQANASIYPSLTYTPRYLGLG